MRIIDQLVYKITGDNSQFDKSVDDSDKKVTKFGSTAKKIFAGVTVAAIAATIKKMADLTIQTASLLDRVDKMSQKIGISREMFQEWDYILSQNGASVDGLQVGLKTLSTAVDEANQGTKTYTEMFDRLNVSVTDANGNLKDQEAIFNEVFTALAGMENQTERTALATRLLGRSATELAPALNAGADAIENSRKKAHELGIVYEDELIDNGVRLTDNVDSLKRAFTAWRTEALSPVLGVMVSVTDKMLGQDSAAERLNTALENLKRTNDEYNTILEDSKGKSDALTEALISQAKTARELAVIELSKAYTETQKGLEKNKEAVEDSQRWIDRYNNSLEEMAAKTKYTATELNSMSEAERRNALNTSLSYQEIANYTVYLDARNRAAQRQIESQQKVNEATDAERSFVVALAQAHLDGNEAVGLYLSAYPELTAEVEKATKAIEDQQRGMENARLKNKEIIDSYKTLDFVNEQIKAFSDLLERSSDDIYMQAYYQEVLNMLNEKANTLKAEQIKKIEDETEKREAQEKLLTDINAQLANTDKLEKALGDQYDQNADKISILTSGIRALIESGVDPETEAIKKLARQLESLTKATGAASGADDEMIKRKAEAIKTIDSYYKTDRENFIQSIEEQADAFLASEVESEKVAKWKADKIKEYDDAIIANKEKAYSKLNSFYASDRDNFIQSLDEQVNSFIESGIDIDDAAQWKKDKLKEYDNEVAENAKQKASEARDAWIAYGFEVVNKLSSIYGNISQIQENTNEKELQRLQALVDATEEGTTARADAEEVLRDKKNDFARQEAERQKKLATFEALLGAAQAIIQVWTDKTLPTWAKIVLSGAAGAATATQLAAIQSTPIPSFDVGSIRIPEDTQAIVHKDEMILPAPLAQQARQEGVSITPAGGGTPAILMIYLDGKKIAESDVQYINSGQVGKIQARIVK